jgi:predicted DCC family thiol-disulfide oxidoreductase YuxK
VTAESQEERLIVLFDGVCNLCSGFVQFVAPRDPDERFAFASLQSDVAQELLADHDVDPTALESIVLIEGDSAYVKSDAILRIGYHLGGIYRLGWPLRVLPTRFRNWWYDFVANRRYRWFGKKDQCTIPDGDLESRFIE